METWKARQIKNESIQKRSEVDGCNIHRDICFCDIGGNFGGNIRAGYEMTVLGFVNLAGLCVTSDEEGLKSGPDFIIKDFFSDPNCGIFICYWDDEQDFFEDFCPLVQGKSQKKYSQITISKKLFQIKILGKYVRTRSSFEKNRRGLV